jgi:hypothetical protein
MTRKHFTAIAAALLASKPKDMECFTCLAELLRWESTAANIMTELARVCPTFNVTRFRKACGFDRQ